MPARDTGLQLTRRGLPIPPHAGWPNRLEYERTIRDLSLRDIAERTRLSYGTVLQAACASTVGATAIALRISNAVYAEAIVPELQELYRGRGPA